QLRVGQLEQLAGKPVVRGSDRTVKRLVWVGSRTIGSVWNQYAGSPGNLAHRTRVVHSKALHQPGEHITRLVAHEAVVPALLGNDSEVPVGASVKGTGATIVGSGA